MKPAEYLRELAFPVTQPTTLVPMVVSWLLFSFASMYGTFGLLLFLATLFPFFAYLMRLLEARATGKSVPVFDAELMRFFGNPSSLFPIVLFAFFGWLTVPVYKVAGPLTAWLFVMAWGALMPASLTVLAVTRSPWQALNPIAIYRVIRELEFDYLVLVIILEVIAGTLIRTSDPQTSSLLPSVFLMYFFFLVYNLTGAVSASHNLADEVEIPEPLPLSPQQQQETLIEDRQKIANHAYGFASRGNREGAFAHVEAHVAGEADPLDARNWFFNNMLTWDDTQHALFYAQTVLHQLLQAGEDRMAIKLIARCLHVDAQFRAHRDDRAAVAELLERYQRDDLLAQMR